MGKVSYDRAWSKLLGKTLGDLKFWVEKKQIPWGTLKPFESYDGNIPIEDIVTTKFDPVDTPLTSRNPLNILFLGASGDGKSQLLKLGWSVMHDAGFFVGYIDPKSTDAGRARIEWEGSKRLPPNIEPKGIALDHFMPIWATRNYEHMSHNFRKYATRVERITEREMWQGLGMTEIAASMIAKAVRKMGRQASIAKLKSYIYDMDEEEMPKSTFKNIIRVLTNLEDYRQTDESIPELNLYRVWSSGKSVVISYNSGSKIQMTFDIGQQIWRSKELYKERGNRTPVIWILDDSSYYAKEFDVVNFNFAKEETINIGFNYRSLGIYNWMAVQSLSIIDDAVAETYPIKFISPLFRGVNQLGDINIPQKAIRYLRDNDLVKDKERHLMQWLLVDENNEVTPFFPFTPPCNHFTEIYRTCNHKETNRIEGLLRCVQCGQNMEELENDKEERTT